jgi:hypothetical protein
MELFDQKRVGGGGGGGKIKNPLIGQNHEKNVFFSGVLRKGWTGKIAGCYCYLLFTLFICKLLLAENALYSL